VASGLRRALSSLGWWDALTRPGPTRLLSVSALTDAAGTGLAAVCLPFLAVTGIGLSAGQVGLVLSVGGVCELLAAVPNGALAGRFGVRRFVLAAKLVEAAGFTALALAGGFWAVLVPAALVGVARAGSSGLNQSLTVVVLGEDRRSAALGIIRALRNIGYLAAGGIGAVLLAPREPDLLRLALLLNAASFLVGAFCVSRLPATGPAQPLERTDWSVLRDVRYGGLVLCAAVFGSSLVVLDVGLPLWALRHPGSVPAWTVPLVVVVNTALVVVLQYRFAQGVDDVPSALRRLRFSTLAFCVMCGLIALTAHTGRVGALALLLVAGVVLTFGELTESPSWWTLSYKLAPEQRRSEYLSAFDLCWAVVAIAGPAAMVLVVSAGTAGWLGYGLVLVLAAAAGTALARGRTPSTPVAAGASPTAPPAGAGAGAGAGERP
jgi:MFS family permease